MLRSDHTALAVRDLDRSRAFYLNLGGRVVSKPSPNFLEIMLGDLRLHLVPTVARDGATAVDEGAAGIDHFCLSVASVRDLHALCERLNAFQRAIGGAPCELVGSPMLGEGFAGHAEERPPLKTLYMRDPDGIQLEIRAYAD
jgi:catechol 2,3-dioxygenase-like lactoylglutathione lyase family enzyme